MAKTIFDQAARTELLARIDALQATAPARWGKFTAPRMVAHLIDSLRLATGALPVKARRSLLSNRLMRYLVIYHLPWPKGAPTAPELLTRVPQSWAGDVVTLKAELGGAAARGPTAIWAVHPLFGDIDGETWGVLIHRHVAHHLTQFGV